VLRNDEIQAAIVAYAKSKTDITDQLTDPEEVREDYWKGREFTYPNIRVRLISNQPQDPECSLHRVTLSFMVFSEEASSQQADRIAGIINNTLHGKSFSSNSISFSTRTTNLIPAIAVSEKVWRAEVLMEAIVSG